MNPLNNVPRSKNELEIQKKCEIYGVTKENNIFPLINRCPIGFI